ncbi:MAG: T9SS type A sorting domain-containing protein [Bacteroidales bacterium]|nr:T9SS type A sorting domain-containing protein [Bacteroidales bacterium]
MKRILLLTLIVSINCVVAAQDAYETRSSLFSVENIVYDQVIDAVVYPNPVINGKFFVSSLYGITSVEVLNVIGQRIIKKEFNAYNEQEVMIELGTCEQGLYLVKIAFITDKTIIKKLLVK